VLVLSKKLYCVSVTYERLTGFEEEDHDGGRFQYYIFLITSKYPYLHTPLSGSY